MNDQRESIYTEAINTVNEKLLVCEEEKKLFTQIQLIINDNKDVNLQQLSSFTSLTKPINNFFENVQINDKNINIKNNRIFLLCSVENYINHCGQASVLLDPIYFGAGNSFYESMFYGTPTVSKPTQYTKSRLVLGAYRQMQIEEAPIVESVDEYVNKSIEIANHKNLYDLKNYYNEKAKKKLYENKFVIDDLEKIFIKLVN